MGSKAYLMEKMQALVGVYHQLYCNSVNYLKILQTNWTYLNPNFDEIYNKITNVL